MKKLYFIRANKTTLGGAENYLYRLLQELKQQNIPYDVINSSIPSILPSWVKPLLFNIQLCYKKKGFYFSLERITCPDIYRAGDGVHKEFLKTKRRTLNPLNIVYRYLEKRCFKNAQAIIANSKMIKKQIIDAYDIPKEKIKVIYNGIVLKKFDYEASFKKISSEFGIDRHTKIILFVGSGFERKGVKEFLKIISLLEFKNFHVFIIGKEKKLSNYQKLATSLKIETLVSFTGPRNDVDDFYTLSDIFLFPTHYEPFSNVILEAMSFQNMVITTKQNGASEILDSPFVMQSPQDFSIVKTIDELLENAQKLEAIKQRNYEIVQNFTIEKNAQETMEVINEYLH